jgi:hypothetical protein
MSSKAPSFFASEATFGSFVRKRPESKPWFDLADDLGSTGVELLRAHSAPLLVPQHSKHCPDLYQLVYRHASADVHVTANSIQRYFVFDAKGRMEALNVAPNADDLVDTLRLACIAMLWALDAYRRLYPKDSLTEQIQNFLRRFSDLPDNEIVKA